MKSYQRRHLRAPFKGDVLYSDGVNFLKAKCLNISEGGMLITELPSIPETEILNLIICLPHIESLKNLSTLQLKTFNHEHFQSNAFSIQAKLVRRVELSQDISSVFNHSFGLEFLSIREVNRRKIEFYVKNFAANLITLQTLIDLYNYDEETKKKARALAAVLGYDENAKIAALSSQVNQDYKSLQWS